MRRVSILLSTMLIVSLLLAACGGEETSTTVPSTNVPPVTVESTMTAEGEATAETPAGTAETTTPSVPVTGEDSSARLSNLLDYDVWNQNGEQVGEVENMVLDMNASNIAYVVIETGGFLDLGDKTVLIPWDSLELQTPVAGGDENAFVLTADAEMLNNAEDVDLDAVLPGIGESADDWDADIRNFWEGGVVPQATQSADATATPAAEQTAAPEMTATTTAGSGTGTGEAEELQGVILASDLLGATITIGNAGGEGLGQGEATALPAATTDPNATSMPEATATTGTGTGAGTDNQGPTEATIEDAIIDPDTGDVLYLVLNSLFDDGERWIPVPLSTLRWDGTNESFLFVANANALQNAPFFQADQWPDTTTEGWDIDFDTFWQTNVTTP
jgi:sporulation protein YlmC with PRC-barrel domain